MCFFPNLCKTLCEPNTKNSAVNDLFNFISQNEHFVVKRIYPTEIVFDVKNTNMPMYNSFLPTVTVTVFEATSLHITISSSLKKSTKVIMSLITIIAAIFEIFLGITVLVKNYSNVLILLLPLGLILAIFLLAYVGLSVSVKDIVNELTTAIKTGDGSLS